MSSYTDRQAVLEDVSIIFRNFRGEAGKYNVAGQRSFAVKLESDRAEAMKRDGWNVKYLEPREEGDSRQAYLPVKVNVDGRPPRVVLISRNNRTELGPEEIELLDRLDLESCDMILNPYDWEINDETGRTAYLSSLYATIYESVLDQKYSDI